jgi:EAL domain-containing protein (putative c-di-GMP-specific phosphodiesterase class I)
MAASALPHPGPRPEGRDELRIDAQPIVRLHGGDVAMEELLLRMLTRGGTVVPPGRFLRHAERTGRIAALDRIVLRTAAGLAAAGRSVSINLSGPTLGDPGFIAELEHTARRTDMQLLTFELNDFALMPHLQRAQRFAQRAVSLGCQLTLENFGSGWGGLGHLNKLPFSFVKIDPRFVGNVVRSPVAQTVVESAVEIARSRGMHTIAVGVEDDDAMFALRALGVDRAQGYHVGRPQPL